MRIRLVLLSALLTCSLSACPSANDSESSQPHPPVIVVQAPPETVPGSGADSTYPGLAWQTPPPQAPAEASAEADPDAEPYDVVALLREFDPQLTDPPKDAKSEAGHDDLLAAFAVMDEKYLYGRILTRAPMKGDEVRETRFWIEQGGKMVTVEVKVGSQGRPCELADITTPDVQNVVLGCFWTGNALDFRIPLDQIPAIIKLAEPFWVSGFQTCCLDAERNSPYDQVEGAQEVWRVAGLASEVDSK